MIPGNENAHFVIANGRTAAPIICWENLFGGYVRWTIRGDTDIVLHLVNDNWSGVSQAAYQHIAASAVRAVENRVPFVVASNTGPSRIIDAKGRILAEQPVLFRQGVIIADVEPAKTRSFYYHYGDWLVMLCGLVLVGVIFFTGLHRDAYSDRREARWQI
jgi:apolipoprotein N-acyltransferase